MRCDCVNPQCPRPTELFGAGVLYAVRLTASPRHLHQNKFCWLRADCARNLTIEVDSIGEVAVLLKSRLNTRRSSTENTRIRLVFFPRECDSVLVSVWSTLETRAIKGICQSNRCKSERNTLKRRYECERRLTPAAPLRKWCLVDFKPTEMVRSLRSALRRSETPLAFKEVHCIRKLIRQIEMFPQCSMPCTNRLSSLIKDLRKVRKKAGAVRDMDVLIVIASRLPIDREEESVLALLKSLTRERKHRAHKLRGVLSMEKRQLQRGLKNLSDIMTQDSACGDKGSLLGGSMEILTRDCISSPLKQSAAWPSISQENLHLFLQTGEISPISASDARPRFERTVKIAARSKRRDRRMA